MLNRIHERRNKKAVSLHPVKMIEQDNMRKSVQILQPLFKFRENLYCPLNAARSGGLNRHSFNCPEGAADYSDRAVFNHHIILFHIILFYSCEPTFYDIPRIAQVPPFFPNDSPCSDYDMQTPDSYHHLCNDIPSISDLQT